MKPFFLILILSSFVAISFQNCSPAAFSTDVHYLDESLNKDGEEDNTTQEEDKPPTDEQPPQTDAPEELPPETEDPSDTTPPGTPGDDDDGDGDHDSEDDAEKFSCGSHKDHKVLICHVPSGNVENRHNICIAKSALKAHIAKHGDDKITDYYGECQFD